MKWLISDSASDGELSVKERFSYGCGDAALAFPYYLINYLLMFYYTDYIGLNSGRVGTIIFFAQFLDGITDIIMGSLIDKTNTKWGKARPWILFSSPFYAIVLTLAFSIPLDLTQRLQYCWVAITYALLMSVFWTIYFTTYTAMNSLMTRNRKEQGLLGIFFQASRNVVVFALNIFTLKSVEYYGNDAKAWSKVVLVYSCIMVVFILISFFGTKERCLDSGMSVQNTKGSLKENLSILVHNRYWLRYCLAFVCNEAGLTLFLVSMIYYVSYVVGDSGKYAFFNNTVTVCSLIVMIPMAGLVVRNLVRSFKLSAVFSLVGCFLGIIDTRLYWVAYCAMIFRGIGYGLELGTIGGMMAFISTNIREKTTEIFPASPVLRSHAHKKLRMDYPQPG